MIYVLDAGALIAYVRDEAGADVVAAVLSNKGNLCFAHAINFCEVFYDFYRTGGLQEAEDVCGNLIRFGVELREDVSLPTWQRAATIKAIHRRVSLADCFAIALAQSLGGTVLTTDHHEFDAIAAANVCLVEFIR